MLFYFINLSLRENFKNDKTKSSNNLQNVYETNQIPKSLKKSNKYNCRVTLLLKINTKTIIKRFLQCFAGLPKIK